MKITDEEYRVYSAYDTTYATYKNLPDKCYEILNDTERVTKKDKRYSNKEHYYKIKW